MATTNLTLDCQHYYNAVLNLSTLVLTGTYQYGASMAVQANLSLAGTYEYRARLSVREAGAGMSNNTTQDTPRADVWSHFSGRSW